MIAYSYDGQGLFIGTVKRQYDELDKRWLMPADATDKAPPEEAGKVAAWNSLDWELKPDNCGEYFDTKTAQKVVANSPLADIKNLTKLVPLYKFNLWDGEKWVEDTEKQKEYDNQKIVAELQKIDTEAIRPLRACIVALLDGKTPDKVDSDMVKAKELLAKEERIKIK